MSGTVGDNTARASGVIASAGGGGKIVQVVQTYKTNVTTRSGGGTTTFYDISGMSRTITPTKASSKILVDISLQLGAPGYGTTKVQADIAGGGYNDIGMPDVAGSRFRGWTGSNNVDSSTKCVSRTQKFLWTPSYTLTDEITCKVLWSSGSGSTVVLNRSGATGDTTDYLVATSSITLWEIN